MTRISRISSLLSPNSDRRFVSSRITLLRTTVFAPHAILGTRWPLIQIRSRTCLDVLIGAAALPDRTLDSLLSGSAKRPMSVNRLRSTPAPTLWAEVEFVLIGGLAVDAWGVVRGPQLDVVQGLECVPAYDALRARATEAEVLGIKVAVAR